MVDLVNWNSSVLATYFSPLWQRLGDFYVVVLFHSVFAFYYQGKDRIQIPLGHVAFILNLHAVRENNTIVIAKKFEAALKAFALGTGLVILT